MNDQPLNANPEFLLHYNRLRRDRAWMRRRGYVLLLIAGILLASVIFFASTASLSGSGTLETFLVLVGFLLLFVCNGLVMLWRSHRPISDDEVARRRQEERRQLFQFAQGRATWHYWSAVAIQFLGGLLFPLLGIGAAWSLLTIRGYMDVVSAVGIFLFLLFGWYSLSRAIRNVRLLRRLAKLSSQELADRLSLGEATEGE